MMPFAFISYDGMIDLYLESEIAPDLSTFPLLSYMLIELDPSADQEKVASRIESMVPSVDVFTPEEVAARDVHMGRTFFAPIMGLLVMVAYVIGFLQFISMLKNPSMPKISKTYLRDYPIYYDNWILAAQSHMLYKRQSQFFH